MKLPPLSQRRWLRALPALSYTVWIFYMGTLEAGPDAPQVNDKLAHLVGFGLLALLLVPALSRPGAGVRRHALVGAALLATLVGALLELVQQFLPHRSAELLDLGADALGAALASAALYAFGIARSRAVASGYDGS